MSLYGFLADALVVLHGLYAGFVVLGLLAILAGRVLRWQWVRNFWFRIIHLGMIGVVVLEALCNIPCPLTEWEASLRHAAGQAVVSGSFVGRCIHDLIFYDAPPWVITLVHCVFGVVVLATMLLFPPQLPGRLGKRR